MLYYKCKFTIIIRNDMPVSRLFNGGFPNPLQARQIPTVSEG